jgi:UDP-GlcNAc:undecaprenyl-phosphate/decaprenyl-phosphate GlcNAc-1-phosphate transferase
MNTLSNLSILNFFIIFLFIQIINLKCSFLLAQKIKLYDIPNNRKIHKKPVLLNGGIFLYLNIFSLFIFYIYNNNDFNFIPLRDVFIMFLSLSVCFFIGLIDDKKNLKIIFRYAVILFFLIIFLNFSSRFLITHIKLSLLTSNYIFLVKNHILLTSLILISFMIMYNLIDGINILSSILTIFYLGYLLLYSNNLFFIFLNINIITSLFIFLYFNYKNLSFLGNGGINMIGIIIIFQIIFISNLDKENFKFDIMLIILMFIIPTLDMIRLFLLRIIENGNPFIPDKNHIHHLFIAKFNHVISSMVLLLMIFWPLLINYLLNNEYSVHLIIIQIILYSTTIFIIKKK